MAKRGIQGAMMRATNSREHTVTVIRTEFITAGFMRIHLQSAELLAEIELVPTAWLRFWFPDGAGREFQRGYTISSSAPELGEFSIDFVLHEPSGPASAWAAKCQPGDTIIATSLGSSKFEIPDEIPAGYLLVGDAASIPGLSGIIEALPADVPIELYLEEHQAVDREIPIPEHPSMRVHWVPRTGPDALANALEARDWSNWHAWMTPESASLKRLRSRMRDEFGFPRSEMHTQAYWVEGRAMGKQREPEQAEPEQADEHRADERPPERKGSWRAAAGGRLLAELKPVFIATGVFQAIVTLIELAPFFLLVELSRRLILGQGGLWAIGIWALVLIGAGALIGAGLLFWLHAVDARFERELRQSLLGKLARLPLGWFGVRGSARVKQLVQDDTLALHYLVTHAVADAVAAVVAPIAVLAYLFAVDWRLALLLFVPVFVYMFLMYLMFLGSYDATPKALKWAERMNGEAAAYLDAQPVVRVFGGAEVSTFRARLGEYIGFLNTWQRPFTGLKTYMDLATRPTTFLLIICVFGTWWIAAGAMDPISILPFLLLGTTFGSRLLGIGYGLAGLRDGLLAAKRLQVVLEEPELEIHTAHDAAELGDAHAPVRVEFDDVSFSYGPGKPALSRVSLTLEPGTVTALVGPSGSGKSTLAALLARFHDVSSGAIRIGTQGAEPRDLRSLTPGELYARVGFVFQDTQLVRGTVRENIALAKPNASPEQIERAAAAANIHERILRMPEGYDSVIDADAALSGGERQRITIARAILADTPVLVLDEATAFADPESEFLVQQAISRLTAGRTVLVIAHRLHTVTDVDRIVVLDNGHVVEQGAHTELLKRGGRYHELWEAGALAANAEQIAEAEVAR